MESNKEVISIRRMPSPQNLVAANIVTCHLDAYLLRMALIEKRYTDAAELMETQGFKSIKVYDNHRCEEVTVDYFDASDGPQGTLTPTLLSIGGRKWFIGNFERTYSQLTHKWQRPRK